jgi:nucleoside-diphosphate kinase
VKWNGGAVEKTFLMIKPEAVEAGQQGQIVDLLLKNGFAITKMKQFVFTRGEAEDFYGIHLGKDFFKKLIEYITSGAVIGMELEKEMAVTTLRELVGATNPAEARPGTIRYMYGTSLQANAVHASDSTESAQKELAIVFRED